MQTRLLRTSGFRIAALYLSLLGVTLSAAGGFVYWSTASLIDRQINDTVEAEIRGLAEQYGDEGLRRLIEVVGERSGPGGDPRGVYLLIDGAHKRLAGNLMAWPPQPASADGWREVELQRTSGPETSDVTVRGKAFELAGRYRLFVGRDLAERGTFRTIMVNSLAWALAPTLLFGLLGSVFIGRYTLRRVDAVRAASDDIIEGRLTRRVPLAGSGDEFDRLAQTINHMLDRIDTLMTGMRAVTDSLAHDLRSPLTRAKSGIELALRTDSNAAAYREALEQTNGEIETILRTFDALINIAQAEANVDRFALEPLNLSELLGDLADVYQPIAEEAGLEQTAAIAPDVTVRGHRQLLGQAIANLLDNAIKFTPAGGRLSVSLAPEGATAVLTVADSGPGIPQDERGHVLERFVRLDDSRGTPGSGLGLSLVAAVAKLHDAQLDLSDNQPGLQVALRFRLS